MGLAKGEPTARAKPPKQSAWRRLSVWDASRWSEDLVFALAGIEDPTPPARAAVPKGRDKPVRDILGARHVIS